MLKARGFLTLVLCLSLTVAANTVAFGQDGRTALHRGYRTGYSDGYMAGYRDAIDNAAKDFRRHSEYSEAKRAYNKDYGLLEDYSDGYRQGFESGYDTGFEKRSFDSAVPSTLGKRGSLEPSAQVPAAPIVEEAAVAPAETAAAEVPATAEPVTQAVASTEPTIKPTIQKVAYTPTTDDPIIIIPRDTELIVEIQEPLSTETNRIGDKFTAKIVSPTDIAGATIEGRIERITKP